jgi:hypothetical protein
MMTASGQPFACICPVLENSRHTSRYNPLTGSDMRRGILDAHAGPVPTHDYIGNIQVQYPVKKNSRKDLEEKLMGRHYYE